jgi:hypothetical protein
MCQCHFPYFCQGCHAAMNRRRFLKGVGAGAATTRGGATSFARAANDEISRIRVVTGLTFAGVC